MDWTGCVSFDSFRDLFVCSSLTRLRLRSRIGTELRLDQPLTMAEFDGYRTMTPITSQAFEVLSAVRIRSWNLVFRADLVLSVQTGRMAAISGLKQLVGGSGTV